VKSIQVTLVIGYLALCALGCAGALWLPRVFWTMLMPIVPLAIVLGGFHAWRRVCPIAAIAALGPRLAERRCAREKPRLRRLFGQSKLSLPLALLGIFLVLRLVATNGDGPLLGLLLGLIALLGALTNLIFGGKTWCNQLCPVGVVERMYTDQGTLVTEQSSACAPCTGCTKSCPDIDQQRAFRADRMSRDRRFAFYAFPGLVWGFYFYYWLREGDWRAFFDGRWAHHAFDWALVTGPGFFFWHEVPAIVAAALTLSLFSLSSYAVFSVLEALLGRGERPSVSPQGAVLPGSATILRERLMAIAAFVAFNLFYCFAGAPSLRLVPGAPEVVAFVVPIVATLVLIRRWPAAPATTPATRRSDRSQRAVDPVGARRHIALPIAH
jgi:hypothetical protein